MLVDPGRGPCYHKPWRREGNAGGDVAMSVRPMHILLTGAASGLGRGFRPGRPHRLDPRAPTTAKAHADSPGGIMNATSRRRAGVLARSGWAALAAVLLLGPVARAAEPWSALIDPDNSLSFGF